MFNFHEIDRRELLTVVGWSSVDLSNRVHWHQVTFGFACRLPTSTGTYIGADAFTLKLTDALVEAGLARGLAAQCLFEGHEKLLRGLTRLEWPEAYPPPIPVVLAPTKRALDEGIAPPPDSGIYFAIARGSDGSLQTACGTLLEIVTGLIETIRAAPAGAPTSIIQVNLEQVLTATVLAAQKAEVDLGAPFTRPVGHSEYLDWYAAVAAHRALSIQRGKLRRAPGPRAAKGKAKGKTRKTKGQHRRASKSPTLTAE